MGLELVAEAARRRKHSVRLIDLQGESPGAYHRMIAEWRPDFIAFSCNYLANVPEIVDLAVATKIVLPRSFICVGGHSASCPRRHDRITFIVAALHESALSPKRTSRIGPQMSVGGKADIVDCSAKCQLLTQSGHSVTTVSVEEPRQSRMGSSRRLNRGNDDYALYLRFLPPPCNRLRRSVDNADCVSNRVCAIGNYRSGARCVGFE